MWDEVKILVVDDTPANLEVITDTLSSAGYTTAIAISGERALKRLENYRPDLILLDVQMPGIDGFETCQQIKANPDTASIPVMFITALSDTESIVKGFSLGAVDYISKPFQEPELLARVKTHLQLKFLKQSLERRVAERTFELRNTLEQLHQSQVQMVQHEKMASLGNLVSGVAHEVNNPLGFLTGSIGNAKEYLQDLIGYIDTYQQHCPCGNDTVQDCAEEIDLEFLCEDFPKLLDSMESATDRIKSISTSLRTFSRADKEKKIIANLHEGLDSTLLILKYRLKANEHRPAIEVIRDYGDLPPVECFPGQLNQVFMNIIANAIDVFDEATHNSSYHTIETQAQQIRIQTSIIPEQNAVEICIADNGKGMAEQVKKKIFDHLFTTKGVGKGTGLGLAIAHQIVVENHSGKLKVMSEVEQGTEFYILLPIGCGYSQN